VAPQIFAAAFVLNGQACMAIKRVYVHESIYADMVAALAELARERVGTMGPLSTQPQYERVKELVSDALRSGAKAVAGGEPTPGAGFFYPPTILTDAAPGSRLVDEEQFGPVLPVIPYSDVDWAIDQANGTEFGLSGSIWTADRALGERLADRLEAGTVWVNHHIDGGPHIPFGGVKASGIGRSNGTAGLHAYTESKTVFIYKDPELV
jgi:acyl-CoA reductase-like NAD-dependent aldehyde dehydrogenase